MLQRQQKGARADLGYSKHLHDHRGMTESCRLVCKRRHLIPISSTSVRGLYLARMRSQKYIPVARLAYHRISNRGTLIRASGSKFNITSALHAPNDTKLRTYPPPIPKHWRPLFSLPPPPFRRRRCVTATALARERIHTTACNSATSECRAR